MLTKMINKKKQKNMINKLDTRYLHLLNQQMVLGRTLFEIVQDIADKVIENHLYKFHHLPDHFVVAKNKVKMKNLKKLKKRMIIEWMR